MEYPLEQLILIKQKKLEEAEKVLREKKEILEEEMKKLHALEKERDEVKEHKNAKLGQLREELDKGTTSDKIQQMKMYLKIVDEQLKQKERKVTDQKKKTDEAEKNVEIARQDHFKKQQDVEKIKLHRKDWEKEQRVIMGREEEKQTDELGSTMHQKKKREFKPKKNKD